MIGVQNQKPKETVKNNFRDFSNSLSNQTKNLAKSFKHLQSSQKQLSNGSKNRLSIQQFDNFINPAKAITKKMENNQPNVKFHSDTWDVRHMDKFLKDNKFSQPVLLGNQTTQASFLKNKQLKLNSENEKNRPGTTTTFLSRGSLNSSQKTLFYNTQQRFGEDYFKKTDYKNNYSDHNFIVCGREVDNEKAQTFYNQRFLEKPKQFDIEKLEFSQTNTKLTTPSEQLKEMRNVRTEQLKFRSWKNDRQNLTKQHRLINSEFRSGVINVDNPYNENTKIYTQELQRIKDRQIKSQQIQKRHAKDLENQNKVNSTIEFFNSKSRMSQPSNLDSIKINPLWNQKTRVQTSKQYKQWNESQTRLFGGPIEGKYSIKRAENIQKNDQRGRDYDFISFSKSHLNGFQKSHQNNEMTQKE